MDAHVDPRMRSKVALNPARILPSSLPSGILARLVLSNFFLVLVLMASKEWLLDNHVSPLWLAVRVLGCGSMGALAWVVAGAGDVLINDMQWSKLGMASFFIVVQQVALYTTVQRMSAVRALILLQSSNFILHSLTNPTTTPRSVLGALTLVLTILSSATFSFQEIPRILPAYFALLLYTVSTNALETTWKHMGSSLGKGLAYSVTTGGAFVFSVLLYGLGRSSSFLMEGPLLSLSSFLPIPFIAMSLLYASPQTSRTIRTLASPSYYALLSFSSTMIFAVVLGYLAFHQPFSLVDLVVACLLIYSQGTVAPNPSAVVPVSGASRIARAYLKTILSNPESRKIFYFLMLNLFYMVVQVVYGIITNSLGLISDAIHMAFDCMAIAMGLFASVAAIWMPNEQYTYGYGRIETLSGFANGIFLLLISIFIVFEAIQRLLDPPEMSTGQLLLVSTLGLGVNLFGMFAMGGHHHHGTHSHSHGAHSHGHVQDVLDIQAHSHSTISQSCLSHAHDPGSDHPQPHSHSHSHSPPHSPHPLDHQHHQPSNDPHTNGITVKRPPSHDHNPRRNPSRPNDLSIHPSHPTNPSRLHSATIPDTPLTPAYRFGQDDHFAEHHHLHHVPNSHDHAHHPSAHEGHSHNMRGVFLHVMADTLGSVGVIISTLLIQFYGWTGFDPIASLFIAVLIAASVIPLVIDSGRVLALDVGERDASIRQTLSDLAHVDGVASYTQPRFWPKDASSVIGSIHIHLEPSAAFVDPTGPHGSRSATYSSVDRVLERVDTLLRKGIRGLQELTIQVEGAEA